MKKKMHFLKSGGVITFFYILFLSPPVYMRALTVQAPESSEYTLRSRILGEEREISIILPVGYETGRGRYGVLYILDAEARDRFFRDSSTAVDLSETGAVPPMIIVGIWNAERMRSRDMIPTAVDHRPGSGGARKFLDFIKDEVASYVTEKYRASDTALLYGGSNAGLFTAYAMLEEPELFRACIASSPTIGHCPDFMREKAETFVQKDHIENRVLFMIYGSEDSERVTESLPAFYAYLESIAPRGFTGSLKVLEGEGHVPSSSLERGLRFIFSREAF